MFLSDRLLLLVEANKLDGVAEFNWNIDQLAYAIVTCKMRSLRALSARAHNECVRTEYVIVFNIVRSLVGITLCSINGKIDIVYIYIYA